MYFGFALDSPNTDLWNIDLLDTYLDLLDADNPSKNFVCLQYVLKTSSRRLGKQKIVTLKMYSLHMSNREYFPEYSSITAYAKHIVLCTKK